MPAPRLPNFEPDEISGTAVVVTLILLASLAAVAFAAVLLIATR